MAKPFQLVGEEEQAQAPPPPQQPHEDAQRALQILALSLQVVSKRFVTALGNLFTLLCVTSAFVLWWRVLPNPNMDQLVGLGLYATFLLAIEYVRRR